MLSAAHPLVPCPHLRPTSCAPSLTAASLQGTVGGNRGMMRWEQRRDEVAPSAPQVPVPFLRIPDEHFWVSARPHASS